MGHSFSAMGHADLPGAIRSHAFGPLMFLLGIVLIAVLSVERIIGRVLVSDSFLNRLRLPARLVVGVWLCWAAARFVYRE